MKFARWVFLVAGIYGLIVITPLYFMEGVLGGVTPPALTHPVFFYGFVGTALAWQVLFLFSGARSRPLPPDDAPVNSRENLLRHRSNPLAPTAMHPIVFLSNWHGGFDIRRAIYNQLHPYPRLSLARQSLRASSVGPPPQNSQARRRAVTCGKSLCDGMALC